MEFARSAYLFSKELLGKSYTWIALIILGLPEFYQVILEPNLPAKWQLSPRLLKLIDHDIKWILIVILLIIAAKVYHDIRMALPNLTVPDWGINEAASYIMHTGRYRRGREDTIIDDMIQAAANGQVHIFGSRCDLQGTILPYEKIPPSHWQGDRLYIATSFDAPTDHYGCKTFLFVHEQGGFCKLRVNKAQIRQVWKMGFRALVNANILSVLKRLLGMDQAKRPPLMR